MSDVPRLIDVVTQVGHVVPGLLLAEAEDGTAEAAFLAVAPGGSGPASWEVRAGMRHAVTDAEAWTWHEVSERPVAEPVVRQKVLTNLSAAAKRRGQPLPSAIADMAQMASMMQKQEALFAAQQKELDALRQQVAAYTGTGGGAS